MFSVISLVADGREKSKRKEEDCRGMSLGTRPHPHQLGSC